VADFKGMKQAKNPEGFSDSGGNNSEGDLKQKPIIFIQHGFTGNP